MCYLTVFIYITAVRIGQEMGEYGERKQVRQGEAERQILTIVCAFLFCIELLLKLSLFT